MKVRGENENIKHVVGKSPQELQTLLHEIKAPIHIVSIYGAGSFHVAWYLESEKKKFESKKEK